MAAVKHSAGRVYAITLRKAHSFMKGQGFDPVDLVANTELTDSYLAEPYNQVSEEQARTYYHNLIRPALGPRQY